MLGVYETRGIPKSQFAELRLWERSQLIGAKPKGYRGRIIHGDDRQTWIDAVKRAIARYA
jgi:hypothetical protein